MAVKNKNVAFKMQTSKQKFKDSINNAEAIYTDLHKEESEKRKTAKEILNHIYSNVRMRPKFSFPKVYNDYSIVFVSIHRTKAQDSQILCGQHDCAIKSDGALENDEPIFVMYRNERIRRAISEDRLEERTIDEYYAENQINWRAMQRLRAKQRGCFISAQLEKRQNAMLEG